ncbi:MAG: prolipoprotein diacylglyceryl transferase [Endomicrobia bacterium]|nr:prolipoprotein diacylglyceryl transferase [Endomicrobiia bacterium]
MILYALFYILGIDAAVFMAIELKISYKKHDLPVLFFGLFGILLGAKIPVWISYGFNQNTLLMGKSLFGGLLGAFVSINLYKFIFKRMSKSFGDNFALMFALGAGLAKLGCFFSGCCGGKEWGFLGIEYYPTQLIESLFNFVMVIILYELFKNGKVKNMLFPIYVSSYMVARFFVEFIRTESPAVFGLTVYQIIALALLPVLSFIIRKRYAVSQNIVS